MNQPLYGTYIGMLYLHFMYISAPTLDHFQAFMIKLGKYEFIAPDNLYSKIGMKACKETSIIQQLCASTFFMVGGWNSAQLNQVIFFLYTFTLLVNVNLRFIVFKSTISVIMSNTPAGCSTKQLTHYAQEIRSGSIFLLLIRAYIHTQTYICILFITNCRFTNIYIYIYIYVSSTYVSLMYLYIICI